MSFLKIISLLIFIKNTLHKYGVRIAVLLKIIVKTIPNQGCAMKKTF